MKYTSLAKYGWALALGLVLHGVINADEATSIPVHDLDPFPVQAGSRNEWERRLDLFESERLLVGPEGSGRSATWISPEDLDGLGLTRIEDIFWMIPGAATQARFGVITVPTLRGDAAETLINGQRRGDNLYGMPLSFTAVESMEVISGPTLLSTGLGKRTGGMVNLSTKRPDSRQQFGSFSLQFGSWIPEGGSYSAVSAALDLNLPLEKNQALRLAAGWHEDETYYHRNGGRDDGFDLYAAWSWDGKSGARVDWLALFQRYDRPQTLGVNRPWQGLIDDGRYFTGEVDPSIGQSDPPGFFDPGIADPGLITGGVAELQPISRDRVLMSEGDIGKGEAFLSQLIWQQPIEPDLRFSQSILVEQVLREKENQFYFSEDVEQQTVDSLSRLQGEVLNRLGEFSWETGLQVRLEERNNRTNYWNEFAYAYDLLKARRFSAFEAFPTNIAPGSVEDGAGRPWYLPSSLFSTPETARSTVRQLAVYGQMSQELPAGWTLDLAMRADHVYVQAAEPRELAGAEGWKDDSTVRLLSGSVSLRRRWESASLYVSFGQYRGIAGNTVGDGVNLYAPGVLLRDDFLNRSRLFELGGQWHLASGVSIRGALFDQKRKRTEFFGSNDIRVKGAELALDWQVQRKTRLNFNAQYLDARYDNSTPAEFGGGSLWNAYAVGAGPTGEGNGLGYTQGFFVNSLPPGDYRIPGLSRWQLRAGIEQSLGAQWVLRFWGDWASSQPGNLAREYEIPAQMEWNASLAFTAERWDFLLLARNVFDADNWIHNGDTFFDQMLVSRNLPLRLEGRFRIRF